VCVRARTRDTSYLLPVGSLLCFKSMFLRRYGATIRFVSYRRSQPVDQTALAGTDAYTKVLRACSTDSSQRRQTGPLARRVPGLSTPDPISGSQRLAASLVV
jgi:hypothetical protein